MDVIRVNAPSTAHADRLVAALDGDFAATTDGGAGPAQVELRLDSDTSAKLISLFDALGLWLSDGDLAACEIDFGARTYRLLPATANEPNDASAFLLERTIQLQTALDSRVVIEQAKGILAERDMITPDDAFERLRQQARSSRMKLHELAAGIVATVPHQATGDGHKSASAQVTSTDTA